MSLVIRGRPSPDNRSQWTVVWVVRRIRLADLHPISLDTEIGIERLGFQSPA